jgi:ATP synthase protein I
MFFSLSLQAVVLNVFSLLVWAWWGWTAAVPFYFGVGVALLNSGLLIWRWHRGLVDYHCDGERHLRSFHRSTMERFFVVGMLLAAGLAGLDLAPLPLLTGFIVGQLAWVIAAAVHKTD